VAANALTTDGSKTPATKTTETSLTAPRSLRRFMECALALRAIDWGS
jgi:hypothetical protein